jgi:hypothetical protein
VGLRADHFGRLIDDALLLEDVGAHWIHLVELELRMALSRKRCNTKIYNVN